MNDSSIYVVTNYKLIQLIKSQSKYYKTNLGFAITMIDQTGERTLNKKDEFSLSYGLNYKTNLYSQGTIGNIKFYMDHNIKTDKLIIFYNWEEFSKEYNFKMVRENGIDSYIGHLLKEVTEEYNSKIVETNKKETEYTETKNGNPEIIKMNPGAVRYEDIKEYIKNKKNQ